MGSEFFFNLKTAQIYQAVKWERRPIFRWAGFLKNLFFDLFLFVFLLFLYGFFADAFSQFALSKLLGLSIIFLSAFFIEWLKLSFLNSKLKRPQFETTIDQVLENPSRFNLADFLSFRTARAINQSRNNSTLLFYNLLKDNAELNFVFSRLLLDFNGIKNALKDYLKKVQPEADAIFEKIILESFKIAKIKNHKRVSERDVLVALARQEPFFREILIDADLKVADIENLTRWLEYLQRKIEERKRFWEWKNLLKHGSLAKQWASGYTVTLDRYSIDWSEMVRVQGFPGTIGHQRAVLEMERVLSRRQSNNNALIVGEAGSGRKSMIQALAVRAGLGESLPEINYKRVVQLDLTSLLAQTDTIEEVSAILDTIFREVIAAGNVILVIDDFHNFVGAENMAVRPGAFDISGVISSYLPLISFQVVAVTTFEGLHKNIEPNSAILSLFEKVEISQISEEETLMLLENLSLVLEHKSKRFISYPALRDIINYCSKYLPATPFPEKALALLDEAMVHLSQVKEKMLLPKHIAKIVSEKTQIPVGEIEIKEREVLLNLEDLIHQRIINQEEAVKEVSAALRRARAEITVRKGPMGCFLFLGPTGVGKTETAKALSEIYFGSENRMIRLDMSEFQTVSDIPRLLGSAGEEGFLTTKVRETPFALVLLDEIEKAHPNILNLFLQVLDEGYLTDGLGRKVDFKNTIIIATSNAGYQVILKALKEAKLMSEIKEELLDFLFQEAIFRPEFINRFDAVIIFKSLTKENLLDIAELLFQKLKKNLKEKEIDFVITQELKEKIVELGYDPTFGARQMRRVIQDKVENVLASAILSGQIKRGYRVEIDPVDFQLKINS